MLQVHVAVYNLLSYFNVTINDTASQKMRNLGQILHWMGHGDNSLKFNLPWTAAVTEKVDSSQLNNHGIWIWPKAQSETKSDIT